MSDDPFIEYRKNFNRDLIPLVNILNKVFNDPPKNEDDIPNNLMKPKDNRFKANLGIEVLNNAENLNVPDLIRSVNDLDGKLKLFDKVCKNISILYTKPMNKNTLKYKTVNEDLPLSDLMNTKLPGGGIGTGTGDIGIQVNNLEEYFINNGTIISKRKSQTNQKICSKKDDDNIIEKLREYFYLKLKILVYLRNVLNLNEEDKINQYEILYQTKIKENPNPKIPGILQNALGSLETWNEEIKKIFNNVLNDKFDNQELKNIIYKFENEDENTTNVCMSLIPICNPDQVISSEEIKTQCRKKKILDVRNNPCKDIPLKVQIYNTSITESKRPLEVKKLGPQKLALANNLVLNEQLIAEVGNFMDKQKKSNDKEKIVKEFIEKIGGPNTAKLKDIAFKNNADINDGKKFLRKISEEIENYNPITPRLIQVKPMPQEKQIQTTCLGKENDILDEIKKLIPQAQSEKERIALSKLFGIYENHGKIVKDLLENELEYIKLK
jgi:hypothetical protein